MKLFIAISVALLMFIGAIIIIAAMALIFLTKGFPAKKKGQRFF